MGCPPAHTRAALPGSHRNARSKRLRVVADVLVVQDRDDVVAGVLDAALGAGVSDRRGVGLGVVVDALAGQFDGLADPVGDGLVVDDERAVVDCLDERAAVVAGHPLEDRPRDLVDGEWCGCHGVLLGT